MRYKLNQAIKREIQQLDQFKIDSLFLKCCINGNLKIIKYLFNSRDLLYKPEINATKDYYNGLTHACANGQLDVVKYLLSSPDLHPNAKLCSFQYDYLSLICDGGHFHIADYLLENNLFDPINAFISTHQYNIEKTPLSDYLIFICKVPFTENIQQIVDNNSIIKQMFELRELNYHLQSLPIVDDSIKIKKLKL